MNTILCGNVIPPIGQSPTASEMLSALEDLYIICDRFSHAIRTHLGVSMGIIDDHLAGYTLERKDYEDAKSALQAILGTLNSVRDITNPPRFMPEEVSLGEFIESEANQKFGLDPALQLFTETEGVALRVRYDRKLLYRALRCLLQYANSRQQRYTAGDDSPISLRLIEQRNGSSRIIIEFNQSGSSDNTLYRQARTWRDISIIDHATESLGLLFAERVFELHGGSSEFRFTEPTTFSFIANLTLAEGDGVF